jgi:hypothetical protein
MDKRETSRPFPRGDFSGERIGDDAQGRPRWLLDGYVLIYEPDHPLASPKNGTVLEHRMILHDAGVDLQPGLEVHHRNGDRADNRIENLDVVSRENHHQLHKQRELFRYRPVSPAGDDLGDATYAAAIRLGQDILFAGGRFRVVDVVVFEEEDESPFVGLLMVEAA